jgi:hypothetical protein
MTNKEKEAEVRRLLGDHRHRMNSLYWIKDKQGNKVKFNFNWAQEKLYRELWYFTLILKARQLGMTTFLCLYFLDACLFNAGVHAGIIAHNREDAEEFFNNKVKFAYDNLPEWLRTDWISAETDTTRQLRFKNGSSIRVGTSMRSGTLQYLHVSEFGKVCAKYPDKAQEIVTGALNTVQQGQVVAIESTAEGRHGYFYDYCKAAQDAEKQGKELTTMDFKFLFFPWWKDPGYVLDPAGVVITREDEEYFGKLSQEHQINLTLAQKAWYVKKKETQGEDMMREYPSTPEEAFLASIKGAYYASQMAKAREQKRLCRVPIETGVPVNTAWDLGMDDQTVIWFHQRIGLENRIIDYYENNGEGLAHYVKVLQDRGYLYGEHFFPHDISVRELGTGQSRLERLESLGMQNITVVSSALSLEDGIEAVRNFLPTCWIDEVRCDPGINALDNYQKEWDEKLGGFREKPLHNWASHGADGFRMLAIGFSPRQVIQGRKSNRRRDGRVV